MNFCVECGARLERRCPQCGAETQPTFKFCGQCGAALEAPEPASEPAPMAIAQVYQRQEAKIQSYTPRHLAEKIFTARSALEGERRQVTVLFADGDLDRGALHLLRPGHPIPPPRRSAPLG